MPIHLEILTEVNNRRMRQQAEDIKRQYASSGNASGQAFAKEFDSATRALEQTYKRMTDAADRVVVANGRVTQSMNTHTIAERNLEAARQKVETQTQKTDKALRDYEASMIAAARAENLLANGTKLTTEQRKAAATAVKASENAQKAYTKELERSAAAERLALNAQVARRNSSEAVEKSLSILTRAEQDHQHSLRETESVMRDVSRGAGDLDKLFKKAAEEGVKSFGETLSGATSGLESLGRSIVPVARGLLAIGAIPILAGISDLGEVAATASESVLLLPAALAAAGAGLGTFMLATSGFDKAIKDSGNVKLFGKDLAKLAPEAQQAAVEIKKLTDGPLHDLQQSTQGAFFKGFAGQEAKLAGIFGPSIKGLTTGIAGSMNEAISGAVGELTSASGQSAIQTTIVGITEAFKNAAPAIRYVVQAFDDLMSVGSSFLPSMGQWISDIAKDFADWVRNARDTGQLKEWMHEGLNAVHELWGGVTQLWGATKDLWNIFTLGSGVDSFKHDMEGLHELTSLLNGDITALGHNPSIDILVGGPLTNMLMKNNAIRDSFKFWPESLAGAVNAMVDIINGFIHKINDSLNNSTLGAVLKLVPGMPNNANLGYLDHVPMPKQPGPQLAKDMPGYKAPVPGADIASNGVLDLPWSIGQLPVPAPYQKPDSDAKARDKYISSLDPSLYKVDPFAPIDGMPVAGSLGKVTTYGVGPGGPAVPNVGPNGVPLPGNPGSYIPVGTKGHKALGSPYTTVDQQEVLDKTNDVIGRGHDLEEDKKDLLAVQWDNTSTAEDLEKAQWKVHEGEVDLQKAQAELYQKQQGTTKNLKGSADALGAALDPDFGIGKGLSGIAENLVKFVGDLALAPTLAKLNAISAASPIQGGYGALGINGANNIANGTSPALGRTPQQGGLAGLLSGLFGGGQQPAGTDADGNPLPPVPANVGPQGDGGYMGDAALLSHIPAGHYGRDATTDLTKGMGDCSSSIEDLVDILDGKSTTGATMYTGNEAQFLAGRGFLPNTTGKDIPGAFNVGMDSHHTQATLPDGTPWNYGSETAAQKGGRDGRGAHGDPEFNQYFYRPEEAPPVVGAAGGTGPAPLPSPWPKGSSTGGGPTAPSQYQPPVVAPPLTGAALTDPGLTPGFDTGGGVSVWGTHSGSDSGTAGGVGGIKHAASGPQDARGAMGGALGLPSGIGIRPGGSAPGQGGSWSSPYTKGPAAGTGGGFPGQSQGPSAWEELKHSIGNWMLKPGNYSGGSMPWIEDRLSSIFGGPDVLGDNNDYGQGRSNFHSPGPTDTVNAKLTPGEHVLTVDDVKAMGGQAGVYAYRQALHGYDTGGGIGPDGNPITPGAQPGPTRIGGNAPTAVAGGGGGIGITPGGSIDTALNLAASAFPGIGQAAATGAKLASRAIQFAGQAASIGVQGLMETFLPSGGSDLANNSWLTRIAGGIASASPALPNTAGGAKGQQEQNGAPTSVAPGSAPLAVPGSGVPGMNAATTAVNPASAIPGTAALSAGVSPPPLTPTQIDNHAANNKDKGGRGGGNGNMAPTVVHYTNQGATEDRAGKDLSYHLGRIHAAAMPGGGRAGNGE